MKKRTLEQIYEEAKKCPVKGRMYVYERFKRQIQDLNLSGYEYTEACRKLADYLEV